MKKLILPLTAFLSLISACNSIAQQPGVFSQKQPVKGTGFAVVELFTSEGCSSCPPADKVLDQLADEYKGKNVLFLEEHVDYWDRLGWKDPFSRKEFTDRQNEYASLFHAESVYTPQAIVNGRTEMTGNAKDALKAAIGRCLEQNISRIIALQVDKKESQKITLSYDAGTVGNSKVWLLLVQRKAITKVERGENSGRVLAHSNIVLAIQTAIAAKGNTVLEMPAGTKAEDCFVVAILQGDSGQITGMEMVDM